jgi:hypothetical protein
MKKAFFYFKAFFSPAVRPTATGFIVLFLLGAIACKKTDTFNSELLTDYAPLAAGKFIRYRMDSTRYVEYGQKEVVTKYQAKDVVEAAITDNAGRPAWRVVRYISDTNGITPWKPISTYMIIPERNRVEYVEDNLRFLRLVLPLSEGFSWKGNSFIDTYTINSELRYMDDWDYTYQKVDMPFTVWNNATVNNTVSVLHRNETIGIPTDASVYSEKTVSREVFAKGIGRIFKEFLHWEYQPPVGSNPGFREGYGIRLTMIDHN